MLVSKKSFILHDNVFIFFCYLTSFFYIWNKEVALRFKLPSLYFYKQGNFSLNLLFENKFSFASFFALWLRNYRSLNYFNFVRLKIKGLGFRIRRVSSSLFRFFFNFTNFFYFHVPFNFIVVSKKKRFIMISNNYVELKAVLSHLLLLKKLSSYRIRGLVYPRRIVFLKTGKKGF